MLTTRTFRIGNGYCHITLDKMLFTDTAEPIEVNELKENRTALLHNIILSIIIAIFVAVAIIGLMVGNLYKGLIFSVLAIALSILVIRRSLYPAIAIVHKSTITKIEFKPFIYGIQNPHFIVHYKSESGWPKKRFIHLVSKKYYPNEEELERIMNIMEEEFSY